MRRRRKKDRNKVRRRERGEEQRQIRPATHNSLQISWRRGDDRRAEERRGEEKRRGSELMAKGWMILLLTGIVVPRQPKSI